LIIQQILGISDPIVMTTTTSGLRPRSSFVVLFVALVLVVAPTLDALAVQAPTALILLAGGAMMLGGPAGPEGPRKS
jgi:hypothetical protein